LTFHYATEDGSGAYLLEDGSGYYLQELITVPYFNTNLVGEPYLFWQPTLAELFSIPLGLANGATVTQITVTASPFVFTAPFSCMVLVGAGNVQNVSIQGTFPPRAPGEFGNPPPGTTFLIGLGGGNSGGSSDSTYNLTQGEILVVTYTVPPQMYSVVL
jgi:hypothetical protein